MDIKEELKIVKIIKEELNTLDKETIIKMYIKLYISREDIMSEQAIDKAFLDRINYISSNRYNLKTIKELTLWISKTIWKNFKN